MGASTVHKVFDTIGTSGDLFVDANSTCDEISRWYGYEPGEVGDALKRFTQAITTGGRDGGAEDFLGLRVKQVQAFTAICDRVNDVTDRGQHDVFVITDDDGAHVDAIWVASSEDPEPYLTAFRAEGWEPVHGNAPGADPGATGTVVRVER